MCENRKRVEGEAEILSVVKEKVEEMVIVALTVEEEVIIRGREGTEAVLTNTTHTRSMNSTIPSRCMQIRESVQ